jgi:hypothetical protein
MANSMQFGAFVIWITELARKKAQHRAEQYGEQITQVSIPNKYLDLRGLAPNLLRMEPNDWCGLDYILRGATISPRRI